jgi:hypothetical protein
MTYISPSKLGVDRRILCAGGGALSSGVGALKSGSLQALTGSLLLSKAGIARDCVGGGLRGRPQVDSVSDHFIWSMSSHSTVFLRVRFSRPKSYSGAFELRLLTRAVRLYLTHLAHSAVSSVTVTQSAAYQLLISTQIIIFKVHLKLLQS